MKYFKLLFVITIVFATVSGSFAQANFMTYNIRYSTPNDGDNWWELRKDEVVELLKYYHPDFLGLQEAMPSQLDFITDHLDTYNYIGHGRDGAGTESEGVPILYQSAKYELLSEDLFWLSETPEKVSIGWDADLSRIAVYGEFKNKTSNHTVHVINAHFDHIGENARHNSAELLIDFIRSKHLEQERVVLMGDFNSTPTESPVELLERILENSCKTKNGPVYGPVGTFNGFNTSEAVTKQIDYIFTKNIDVKSYRCIDDRRKNNLHMSDHFPIIIQI